MYPMSKEGHEELTEELIKSQDEQREIMGQEGAKETNRGLMATPEQKKHAKVEMEKDFNARVLKALEELDTESLSMVKQTMEIGLREIERGHFGLDGDPKKVENIFRVISNIFDKRASEAEVARLRKELSL
jgi:hypothetical protein